MIAQCWTAGCEELAAWTVVVEPAVVIQNVPRCTEHYSEYVRWAYERGLNFWAFPMSEARNEH